MLLLKLPQLQLILLAVLHVVDGADSDLELVLSPGIGHDLPVMNALSEDDVAEYIPENILIFLDVNVPVVCTHLEQLLRLFVVPLQKPCVLNVPDPVGDDDANDLPLGAESDEVVQLELLSLAPECMVVPALVHVVLFFL